MNRPHFPILALLVLIYSSTSLCQPNLSFFGDVETAASDFTADEGRVIAQLLPVGSQRSGYPIGSVSASGIDGIPARRSIRFAGIFNVERRLTFSEIGVSLPQEEALVEGAFSVNLNDPPRTGALPAPTFTAALPVQGSDQFSKDVFTIGANFAGKVPGISSQFYGQTIAQQPGETTIFVGYLGAGPIRNELTTRIGTNSAGLTWLEPLQVDEGVGQITDYDILQFLRIDFKGAGQPRYLFAWTSFGSTGDDNSLTSVQARFADAGGAAVGDQVQVNTLTAGRQSNPRVAVAPNNDYVVVWQSDASAGDDNSLTSIQARLYNASGTPKDVEFQVNQNTMGDQYQPDVAMAGDGSFVVAWTDLPLTTSNVFVRQFDADGKALSDEIQVNTLPGADSPSIAIAGDNLLIAWRRVDTVEARGIFNTIFGNGFEGE